MLERWRQENFFKYLRGEYTIDALVDYQVDPDDPSRSPVPYPAWKTSSIMRADASTPRIS
jgi:hypothetical protein